MTKNINKIITQPRTDLSIEQLNETFQPLGYKERIEKIYEYFDTEDILMTSSFGTKSVFLLDLITKTKPNQLIHFINTTYHFPETLQYKKDLTQLLNLNIKEVLPGKEENRLTTQDEWWKDHPKMCCTINKIAPLEPIVAQHKIWVSGLMSYQTDFRSRLRVFEQQGDIIKFHPLIDINEGEFLYHLDYHKLPHHPLEAKGYGSIGCTHCTIKGQGRSGRWSGKEKKECGLHPNYFTEKKKAK